jgi:2-polyprenyl-3-methyl-5-hydroxy-6-metoxy-1,4-benzoquinol methylase
METSPDPSDPSPPSSVLSTPFGCSLNDLRHCTVCNLMKARKVLRLLDLGCSRGEFLRLAARTPRLELLVGMDLDKDAVCAAAEVRRP